MNSIALGIGILLIAILFSVYCLREGFQTRECSSYLTCADCASTDTCGWCSNAKKCVGMNRMGNPLNTCTMKFFATSPTQCAATRPSFAGKQVSSELTGTGTAARVDTKKKPPALIGGNCPSTDKIVEVAETKLADIVKGAVRSELTKYNIPLVEGFQTTKERDISTLLLAEVGDKVKKMVATSAEAAGYKATA